MEASDRPLKCAARDFLQTPFYILQKNRGQQRYVVSLTEKEDIKDLLMNFIDQAANGFEVKIRDHGEQADPKDYWGEVTRPQLKIAIEKFGDFIFHDGKHDLMIKHSGSNDYIVFDEHALVFIYSDNDYTSLLHTYNLVQQADGQFIYNVGHWHIRQANAMESLARLINLLELMPQQDDPVAGKSWWRRLLGL